MEKLTLKPLSNEIVVNNGAAEGAVDLFCYSPDDAPSKSLGSLYVVGHRESESSNMGYMVSLIAALARREYYAQPTSPPREAFARTLRKANEVVEEFFRSGDVKLSVGIVAVAGGQIMVSKLDKFKILLARENQVIDILSNVLLFSKEHTEKRKFSSIIHGSIQAGDRILAFVPTRAVTTRERNLKSWFLKLPQDEFAQRVAHIGEEHASFATAMVHIDITQSSEPACMPSPQPPELTPPAVIESPIMPSLAAQSSPEKPTAPIAWTPRQQSGASEVPQEARVASATPQHATNHEIEVPHLIPTEFSRGIRRTAWSRLFGHFHFVRLDKRGKAITLAVVVALVTGGVLLAKSMFIVSPRDQEMRQALFDIRQNIERAIATNADGNPTTARDILSRALSTLETLGVTDDAARDLSASIMTSLDTIDRAEAVAPTLIASPAPDAETISFATWSSSSQSIRVGGYSESKALWVATLEQGSLSGRAEFGTGTADMLIGWRGSVVLLNSSTRTATRIVGGEVKSYVIPLQETILDAVEFADSLYVLTDRSILKISDLDTDKPVTKRWLTNDDQLAPGSMRLFVDGSVYTMGRDGLLTTYYKGKKQTSVTAPLSPSGTWRLLPSSDGLFAVAVGDARRIYLINPEDGSLVRTLKIDSQLPFTHIAPGPDNSVLLLTSEGKLWQAK